MSKMMLGIGVWIPGRMSKWKDFVSIGVLDEPSKPQSSVGRIKWRSGMFVCFCFRRNDSHGACYQHLDVLHFDWGYSTSLPTYLPT